MLWRGLDPERRSAPDDSSVLDDLASMRQRQASGELTADLDARFLRLALMAVVMAPMMTPAPDREDTSGWRRFAGVRGSSTASSCAGRCSISAGAAAICALR